MGFEDLLNNIDNNETNQRANETPATNSTSLVELKKGETELSVDLSKFDSNQIAQVNKIKDNIEISNSNSIAFFGSDVQKNIAKFADGILSGVKTKDTGEVGENLGLLLTTMQDIDMEKLQEKDGIKRKIPFLKRISKNISSYKIKLDDVTETIDKIVVSLDKAKSELIRDINILDSLYDKNLEYLNELEMYIVAGELKLNELKKTVLVELKTKAEQTKDMLDIQRYNDFAQMLNEMEKRIHDLRLSREIAIQTLPQIRIIQGNDKVLANKIQASILTTIPIWKNQIALTISLNKQKTALEIQKRVTDTTEDLLRQNAELLKTNSIEIARESERGVISLETLKHTHTKLIETIEESMKIYQEGKQKRNEVEKELTQLEETQKQKLLSIRNSR
ncbi:MAG TPA: toxic anion resistance protein [Clostridium sp.]|jgi:uncharacterized protein YaaN involved in tellurite resistance|nr:toxic anion resistance protein [Clostridium sp.]